MSLNQKFSFWIISVLLVVSFFSIFFHYRQIVTNEEERLRSLGSTVGRVLEEGLEDYMLSRDSDALDRTMNNLRDIKPIKRIWLINREGVVRAGTEMETNGIMLAPTDPRCARCHEKGRQDVFLNGKEIFRWVQPVRNRPQCFKCHDSSIKFNGVIIVDFSFAEFHALAKTFIVEESLSIFLSFVLVGCAIFVCTRTLIINRLNTMIHNVMRFRDGDYGARIPIQGNDEITRLGTSFNEMAGAITDRDREKDLLLSKISGSQKEWMATFDSIGDMIAIVDKDYRIIRANRAFADHFGLTPKEVIDRTCNELVHGTEIPPSICPLMMTLTGKETAYREILDPKTKKVFTISEFPYFSFQGEFLGSIHIARDITEEKEREMRLIMSDRLAALGQLYSGIAHEINNPLASIAGCAEGLLSRLKNDRMDSELFTNYLRIIEEEVARCKEITTNMLSFVRETTYERKKTNLHETLEKAIEIIGFQGRLKEIEVTKRFAESLPAVYGSEGELRQVFLTIISNAIDAMEEKGALAIETGVLPAGIHLGKTDALREVFIKISDNGRGIPPEHIDKIFTPFFTTKSEKGGTGLGLSLAHKIIMNHSGRLSVASEEGKGSTFEIILPA